MRKLLPIMGLTLFFAISCEDEVLPFNCDTEAADLTASAFPTQLEEYFIAAFGGDSTYVQPSDWGTNCNSYTEGMQQLFDEGCFTAEDSVTQESIDQFDAFCSM